ncbi:anti-sigma factor family protein [Paenibacillus arenilitoris]|uniref:Zf-HC2 domain-containing protein n=1 Tax=Paenibacillus arenilitoris TaxID=2772299 RepID=A0A927H6K9_9BACL|nr:zf-HC2 domain-containing protein [Paenibacillus arenilitoris]MBD2869673.1 zf-HC2 domain-containing protein [Paenibacillus arenilitoris]
MNCNDAQQKFGEYWDLAEHDADRIAIELHLLGCRECAEQFRIWEESEEMIRVLSVEEDSIGPTEHVNRKVMERIYAEQSWLMPVPHKSYQFSKSFRRNFSIVLAACMAMFACAFFMFVFDHPGGASTAEIAELSGLMDTANVDGDGLVVTAGVFSEVPVASISDPFVLKVVPAFPQYYVALSLLGLVMTLLILNWLSRTRS